MQIESAHLQLSGHGLYCMILLIQWLIGPGMVTYPKDSQSWLLVTNDSWSVSSKVSSSNHISLPTIWNWELERGLAMDMEHKIQEDYSGFRGPLWAMCKTNIVRKQELWCRLARKAGCGRRENGSGRLRRAGAMRFKKEEERGNTALTPAFQSSRGNSRQLCSRKKPSLPCSCLIPDLQWSIEWEVKSFIISAMIRNTAFFIY